MIVVTGSLAFDFIFNFPGRFGDHIMPDKVHEINLSFIVDKFEKRFGGTAGNIAYNLSLLGVRSAIVGTVGNDFTEYRSWLLKNKISLKYLKTVKKENSSTGFVMNDKANNQIWGYSYGALKHGAKMSLSKIKEPVSLLVISANFKDSFLNFTNQTIELDIPYLYDFGMLLTDLKKAELVKGVLNSQIAIGNDYEISLMMKKTGLSKKDILKKTEVLITTLGEKGSLIETKNKKLKIPAAKPYKVVDPTGAGDAYRAGFLAGMLRGFDLGSCGKIGSVAAVYAVERYGTQEHSYKMDDFTKRFKNNYNKDLDF